MKRHSSASAPPPVVIEGYTGLTKIGAGGFSVVYSAHEQALNRMVAIKVLNTGLTTESDRRAFERECKALGQLDHPDIVRVYRSAYTSEDRPCIVMELYESNFRDVLSSTGALPPAVLLDVGVRMAVALHVAHTKGMLHRDVKPHNIFRSRYGDPALGDFGISTVIGERTQSGPGGLSIAYAAPELLEEDVIGPATDVYALAATLYHLASGRPPFDAGDLRHTVRKILTEEAPPVARQDLPAGFDRVIRAALAKDPTLRPASALIFAEMLREVQARGGYPQTAIKLELGDPNERPSGLPDANSAEPAIVTPPSTLIEPAAAREISKGATVMRRPRDERSPAPESAVPVSGRRSWIAKGAAVAAAVLVVVGILVSRSPGDTPTTTTVASTTPPVDSFLDVIAAPSAASVSLGTTPGTFSVDITAVPGAIRYLVTPVGGDARTIDVTPAGLPLQIDAAGASDLCVIVQAVADSGRLSAQSQPFCS
ncbi:MAG: serine/threonine-protein kinase [Ilumatobacteraceae bacterium]